MSARNLIKPAVLVLGAVMWVGLFVWLGFLVRFERHYGPTYFAWLRAHLAIPEYAPPAQVGFRNEKGLVWYGFWEPEAGFRWSIGRHSAFLFRLSSEAAKGPHVMRVHTACTLGPQSIGLVVNDKRLTDVKINGVDTLRVAIPAGLLTAGANSIELLLPQAIPPPDNITDKRVLGIGVIDFALEPGSQASLRHSGGEGAIIPSEANSGANKQRMPNT